MIKNNELYDFEKEPDSAELESDINTINDENLSEEPEPAFLIKLLYQSIISIGCLILLLVFSKSELHWLQWVTVQFRYAVNASTEDTFGWISRSQLYKSIVSNTGNLVRLEEITKNLSSPELSFKEHQAMLNPVWPVQGNIIKGYGWKYNEISKIREFNSGIEVTAAPDTPVLAVADGTVSRLNHQPGNGWEIVIEHGEGWSSVYRYLGQVNVIVGQVVKAGQPIARIGRPNQEKGPVLLFEIKEYDQPIDPLSVLVS